MRSQRAGYFSGGESPKAKPVPPLRERIDPTQKLLNEIDSQEAELESDYAKGRLDADDYFDLKLVLERKREAAARRSDSVRGIPPAKRYKDSDKDLEALVSADKGLSVGILDYIVLNPVRFVLGFLAVLWILTKFF